MQVNRPKEYRPELATSEKPLSREETEEKLRLELKEKEEREEKMRSELGLEGDRQPDEEEEKPTVPARKPASKSKGVDDGTAQKLLELEARNAELEKKLAGGAQGVETIKKLANSRMANITKQFEEKLATKDKEFEEMQAMSARDVEQIASLKKQLESAGLTPVAAAPASGVGEDRMAGELEMLRRENAALKAKGSSGGGGAAAAGGDARSAGLEMENKDLRKTIDNLQECIIKLQANNETLENKVANDHPGGGAAPGGGGGGDSEAIKKLQDVLKKAEAAREKKEAENATLKKELESKSGAESKASAAVMEEVKSLRVQLNEKEKALSKAGQDLKAATEDAALKDKEKDREIARLNAEVVRLNSEGTAQLAEVRSKIRKAGRKILQDMGKLRESRDAAKQAVHDFQAEMMPAMKNFYSPLKKAIGKVQKDNAGWAEKYKKEVLERKRLHNLVLELKGNIRVFCRVRPKLPHEDGEGCDTAVLFPEDKPELEDNFVSCFDEAKGSEKIFEFDHTFGPSSTQEQVFEEVEALVTSVLDGYNVCIFAYGQTGSGKTYTMEGEPNDKGINPRTLARLFDQITSRNDYDYQVEFSVLEIYNEEIKDLLDPKPQKKLEVRQGPDGNFVQELQCSKVKTYDDVIALWAAARENRTTFSNNINEHSSRSHLVISVYARGENRATGVQSFGKLHLVDLAGSERLSRTNATGDRLKEAQNINKSLSALGDVIAAAANKAGHIPYRNSKLTHVLQDSLGQDSKTLMIVQSSPLTKDIGESICSLTFAARARTVELGQAKKHTGIRAKK
mmetsp:Transcript_4750/g.10885  ORF Transcript_4750/g.10885 Transcript_4750/m.10885 type:complete len:798 (+) Transcript_4750:195-2588(+)